MESKPLVADSKNHVQQAYVVKDHNPIASSDNTGHTAATDMQSTDEQRNETGAYPDDPPPAYQSSYNQPAPAETERDSGSATQPSHDSSSLDPTRCALMPDQTSVWQVRGTRIRLGALAGAVLVREKFLDEKDLEVCSKYDSDPGPTDPISGVLGTTANVVHGLLTGIADYPDELSRAFKTKREKSRRGSSSSPSSPKVAPADQQSTNRKAEPSTESKFVDFVLDRGLGRIVGTALKAPVELTYNVARGFHNTPKLYGDTTVRPSQKITDAKSGFEAAGLEFGYGLFDGITGLVTQPVKGAQENGAVGFFSGIAKGIGGAVCKPSAAAVALPGYAFEGIYREIGKLRGSDLDASLRAACMERGRAEMEASTKDVRQRIVNGWLSAKVQMVQ